MIGKLFLLSILAIGLMHNNTSASELPNFPQLPSHEEFLKSLVEEGRMTPGEAREDLALAKKRRAMMKQERISTRGYRERSRDTESPLPEIKKNSTDFEVGTIFSPGPVKRKIPGTNRNMVSVLPIYHLHDGEYMIPLIPKIILNGAITPNGYFYTVTGVKGNYFKLVFEIKYTSIEIEEVLKSDRPPFQIQ